MAMQRHTGCHLPPREAERPAENKAKPEAGPVPSADTTRQPPERPQD